MRSVASISDFSQIGSRTPFTLFGKATTKLGTITIFVTFIYTLNVKQYEATYCYLLDCFGY